MAKGPKAKVDPKILAEVEAHIDNNIDMMRATDDQVSVVVTKWSEYLTYEFKEEIRTLYGKNWSRIEFTKEWTGSSMSDRHSTGHDEHKVILHR